MPTVLKEQATAVETAPIHLNFHLVTTLHVTATEARRGGATHFLACENDKICSKSA